MKTYFSIIYIPLNPALNEKVGIGLIMFNNEDSFFKVSETKLNVIKNLIPHQNFSILRTYFRGLNKELNANLTNGYFNLGCEGKDWLNESYMQYLHRYANNLASFSEPKSIDIPLTEQTFKLIYEKYIFNFIEEEEVQNHSIQIEQTIKLKLYSKIQDRVNIDTIITPNDFEELITPVEIGFIGRNGTIVAGQTMDFSKRLYNLENDLTKFISFTKAADYKQGQKKGKYFVVGEEPSKENKKNHLTWQHVKDSNLVDYIDTSELEKIQVYIENKEVTPYF